jgi:hypothetical protein
MPAWFDHAWDVAAAVALLGFVVVFIREEATGYGSRQQQAGLILAFFVPLLVGPEGRSLWAWLWQSAALGVAAVAVVAVAQQLLRDRDRRRYRG